jgi:hypothetical protein
MSKIVLEEVTNSNNISKINENFAKLETALNDKVLYRDNPVGEPNTFNTDVDVNGKILYNLPVPLLDSQAARLKDVQQALQGNAAANLIGNTPAGNISATNVQTAINELDTEKVSLVQLAASTGVSIVGSAAWYASTITGFNATVVPDGAIVIFSGRDSQNDGGGGTFVYNKTSSQGSDGGAVFAPTGGGRLFRSGWTLGGFNGTLKVEWFGAKGDGVTDDASALQSAINATVAGGVLEFGAKNYKSTVRLSLSLPITLQGDTQYVTSILFVGCSGLIVNSINNIQIKNISLAASIRHTTTPNIYIGIQVTGATGTRPTNHIYRDIYVDGFQTAYKADWLWSSTFDNFKCGNGQIGVQVTALSVNNTVINSSISCDGTTGSRGIKLDGNLTPSEGWMILSTLVDNCEINIEGIAITHVYISNCILDHAKSNAIIINGSGANFGGNWTIRGNYIAMGGASGDTAIKCTNAAVSTQNRGNIISNNQILVYTGSACTRGVFMSGAEARNNIISGNTFKGFTTADIRVVAADIITNNNCQSSIAINIDAAGTKSVLSNNIGIINFAEFSEYMPLGQNKVTWSYTIPTTGTWTQGDICWKSNVGSAGIPGWVCTASGTPGTWKAMAAVAA